MHNNNSKDWKKVTRAIVAFFSKDVDSKEIAFSAMELETPCSEDQMLQLDWINDSNANFFKGKPLNESNNFQLCEN